MQAKLQWAALVLFVRLEEVQAGLGSGIPHTSTVTSSTPFRAGF